DDIHRQQCGQKAEHGSIDGGVVGENISHSGPPDRCGWRACVAQPHRLGRQPPPFSRTAGGEFDIWGRKFFQLRSAHRAAIKRRSGSSSTVFTHWHRFASSSASANQCRVGFDYQWLATLGAALARCRDDLEQAVLWENLLKLHQEFRSQFGGSKRLWDYV